MKSRAGYILTGGRSSRFGTDKALVDYQGRPMAVHIADLVTRVAGSATLVGAPQRYRALAIRVIPDVEEGLGPLAGLSAAVADASAQWVLTVACDMPQIRPAFLDLLFATAEAGGVQAVVPIQPDGRKQPLCAVYAKTTAVTLAQALEQGRRRADAVLDQLDVRYLDSDDYAEADPYGQSFINVNTPGELPRSISP